MTNPDEPLYTLAEAMQIARDQDCARQMHRLTPVDQQHNRLRCGHCERVFDLVLYVPPPEEPPA